MSRSSKQLFLPTVCYNCTASLLIIEQITGVPNANDIGGAGVEPSSQAESAISKEVNSVIDEVLRRQRSPSDILADYGFFGREREEKKRRKSIKAAKSASISTMDGILHPESSQSATATELVDVPDVVESTPSAKEGPSEKAPSSKTHRLRSRSVVENSSPLKTVETTQTGQARALAEELKAPSQTASAELFSDNRPAEGAITDSPLSTKLMSTRQAEQRIAVQALPTVLQTTQSDRNIRFPIVPSGSVLSEVVVEGKDEGSSSEEDDSEDDIVKSPRIVVSPTMPRSQRDDSMDDIDFSAVLRSSQKRLTVRDILSEEDIEDSDNEKESSISDEDEEEKQTPKAYRRLSGLTNRHPSTPSADDSDIEDEDVINAELSERLIPTSKANEAGPEPHLTLSPSPNSEINPLLKDVNGSGESVMDDRLGDRAASEALAEDNSIVVAALGAEPLEDELAGDVKSNVSSEEDELDADEYETSATAVIEAETTPENEISQSNNQEEEKHLSQNDSISKPLESVSSLNVVPESSSAPDVAVDPGKDLHEAVQDEPGAIDAPVAENNAGRWFDGPTEDGFTCVSLAKATRASTPPRAPLVLPKAPSTIQRMRDRHGRLSTAVSDNISSPKSKRNADSSRVALGTSPQPVAVQQENATKDLPLGTQSSNLVNALESDELPPPSETGRRTRRRSNASSQPVNLIKRVTRARARVMESQDCAENNPPVSSVVDAIPSPPDRPTSLTAEENNLEDGKGSQKIVKPSLRRQPKRTKDQPPSLPPSSIPIENPTSPRILVKGTPPTAPPSESEDSDKEEKLNLPKYLPRSSYGGYQSLADIASRKDLFSSSQTPTFHSAPANPFDSRQKQKRVADEEKDDEDSDSDTESESDHEDTSVVPKNKRAGTGLKTKRKLSSYF